MSEFFSSRSSFLSILAVLGLLGFITGNYGFFGFFGFLGFLGLEKEDERLHYNRGRAAYNALIVSIASLAVIIAAVSIWDIAGHLRTAIGLVFAAQILTYSLSLVYYERRGM